MIRKKYLEKVIDENVKPVVEKTVQKYIGVTIKELNKDITEKLRKNPLIEIHVDTTLPLKDARKVFRKSFLERLLKSNFGDVTAVAKICKVDRKTIHRMINELGIDIKQCRKALLKPEYVKMEALSNVLENTLKDYDNVLHPKKMSEVYKNVEQMTKEIMTEFNFNWPTLKDAEAEFEREFLKKVLDENGWNITATAKKLKIRYETLHRKIKSLKISRAQVQ
jgi:DNA-binding NtrC family response regulator